MAHTILLLQETENEASRIWEQYEQVDAAIKAIVNWYEDEIRHRNPKKQEISYTAQDLLNYMDSLKELVCLRFVFIHRILINSCIVLIRTLKRIFLEPETF
jgi:hypothetical protein